MVVCKRCEYMITEARDVRQRGRDIWIEDIACWKSKNKSDARI